MVTLYASADRIRARAGQLDPVKVLIAVVGALPFLLFGLARVVWFVLSLLIAAGMEGWDATDRQINARRTDPRGG